MTDRTAQIRVDEISFLRRVAAAPPLRGEPAEVALEHLFQMENQYLPKELFRACPLEGDLRKTQDTEERRGLPPSL